MLSTGFKHQNHSQSVSAHSHCEWSADISWQEQARVFRVSGLDWVPKLGEAWSLIRVNTSRVSVELNMEAIKTCPQEKFSELSAMKH